MMLQPTPIEKVAKPWGHELVWARTESYVARLLHIRRGESISRRYYTEQNETLYLVSGTVLLTLSSREEMHTRTMVSWEAYGIPAQTTHWLEALEDSYVVEVTDAQPGEPHCEPDRPFR